MEEKKTHGGSNRGQGRKPLAPGESSQTIQARVTAAQADKFKRFGGAHWLRQKIDQEIDTFSVPLPPPASDTPLRA